MIRLVHVLRRKPGAVARGFPRLLAAQARNHLVARFAEDLKVLRHVQTHTLDDDSHAAAQRARGGNMEPHYDGVAETWWYTERRTLKRPSGADAGRAAGDALVAGEAEFIDLPRSPIWFAYEYPQVNPSPENVVARVKSNVVRVFFPLRHKATLTEEQARHYWLTQPGPIVRSHAEASGTLCYRQVHRANSPMDEATQALRRYGG